MALAKCNECGGAVSSEEQVCPHCGNNPAVNGGFAVFIFACVLLFALLLYGAFYIN